MENHKQKLILQNRIKSVYCIVYAFYFTARYHIFGKGDFI